MYPSSVFLFAHTSRLLRRRCYSAQALPDTALANSTSTWSRSDLKYAFGGWTLFILENVILSENRAAIISSLNNMADDPSIGSTDNSILPDESNYRILYGTCSTIATLSILYGYRQLRFFASQHKPLVPFNTLGSSGRVAAASLISMGLLLMSQTLPKMQIPVEFVFPALNKEDPISTGASSGGFTDSVQSGNVSKSWSMKIRCPFDFSMSKPSPGSANDDNVVGVERITRHPGLWSFGLVCAGNAFLQPTSGLALWMTGPILVALLGGYHQDSRASRNMGDSFPSAIYEQQTSNVPFLAMLLGQQKEHDSLSSFYNFITKELKPLNALFAVVVGVLYVANRKPIPHAAFSTRSYAAIKKRHDYQQQ